MRFDSEAIMTLSRFILKALVLLWPFLKAAVFKERTVKEVILENKHLTGMLLLLCLLTGALFMTTLALSDTKDAYRVSREQLAELQKSSACLVPVFDKAKLNSLLQ
jgi:hypothetical protein